MLHGFCRQGYIDDYWFWLISGKKEISSSQNKRSMNEGGTSVNSYALLIHWEFCKLFFIIDIHSSEIISLSAWILNST